MSFSTETIILNGNPHSTINSVDVFEVDDVFAELLSVPEVREGLKAFVERVLCETYTEVTAENFRIVEYVSHTGYEGAPHVVLNAVTTFIPKMNTPYPRQQYQVRFLETYDGIERKVVITQWYHDDDCCGYSCDYYGCGNGAIEEQARPVEEETKEDETVYDDGFW